MQPSVALCKFSRIKSPAESLTTDSGSIVDDGSSSDFYREAVNPPQPNSCKSLNDNLSLIHIIKLCFCTAQN
uniref:Uncharacterized protein n=1 Tax=Timema tahoe TaxID=61484 RepID=A0A7R9FMY4_9NEOP|nr:unnamed protein product [Timema tahoe]